MPRAAHSPTGEQRQLVQLHTTIGTPQEVVADILGIDAKTLRKHYRQELTQSKAKANATIGGALFNKAKDGDTAAMIFWMKTQAGWREKSDLNLMSEDGSMTPSDGGNVLDRINSRLDRLVAANAKGTDTQGPIGN